MNIENKTLLITGANRGIGRALLEEAWRRGAKRVYAATRQPFTHSDGRVTFLTLDVTNSAQIQQAVSEIGTLDLLINNAGICVPDDLSSPELIERHLAVNFFGLSNVTRAFLPMLKRSKGGHRQHSVVGRAGSRACVRGLLHFEGRRAQHHTIIEGILGASGSESPRCLARAY
jgi:NAD(P)-dependent dehydrogenase (short-subunit alcohol dehydrogenase family)